MVLTSYAPYGNAIVGSSALRQAVRAGTLVRVGYDTYLPVHPPQTQPWERARTELLARCAALQRRSGPATVISHTTAALVHGLWVPATRSLHVTQPYARPSTPQRPDPVLRHRRPLDPAEITTVGGLRVTTLQRTVVDSLTMLPADWGLAVADSALRLVTRADRRDPDRARRAAEPYRAEWLGHLEAAGPRRGRPRARAVLAVADPLAESAGESRTRAMLLAAGLPVPQLQIPVVAEGTTFYADLGWEIGSGRYLLVEFDGLTKYALDGERGADLSRRLAAEKLREDAIRRLGHQLERAVHADLSSARRRELLVARVGRKLPAAVLSQATPRPSLQIAPIAPREW